MELFSKKNISQNGLSTSDKGVYVHELVEILDGNNISNDLLPLLNIDAIKNEFIEIKGAKTLVNIQKTINSRFHKEDLESNLNGITLYNDNDEFTINFNDIQDNDYFDSLNLLKITATPIYSASRDFFSELFQMDRYANRLINQGHKKIVEANLQMLKDVRELSKKYRILHDKDENNFYLRAIISLYNYHNYDNNVAVVVGLLTLHNETKRTNIQYNLKRCEYNESFIKMFFESSEIKELSGIGKVKNMIEISNDEIKREALRFSGICSIIFNDKNEEKELFIRSKDIKSKILTVKHNQIPQTAIKELANISNAKDVFSELYKDILNINKIKKPEQIKYLVKSKVEKAKSTEIKKIKTELLKELDNHVFNIIQLLTVFKKVELLAGEDIEAVEYLRFVISKALIKKRK